MNNLIKSSVEYYDMKNYKFKDIFIDRIQDENSDVKDNFIKIKGGKKLKYEILGKIDKNYKMITWSWSLTNINKNKTYISRELLNYGLDLNDNNLIELKNILINSKIRYQNINSLNILLMIFLFLTKKDIIKFVNNDIYIIYEN